jgi:hypothetical protein
MIDGERFFQGVCTQRPTLVLNAGVIHQEMNTRPALSDLRGGVTNRRE